MGLIFRRRWLVILIFGIASLVVIPMAFSFGFGLADAFWAWVESRSSSTFELLTLLAFGGFGVPLAIVLALFMSRAAAGR